MTAGQIGIAFHGIGKSGRELEDGEARYWISRDFFLRILDSVASLPDPNRVILTFDDSNVSDHDVALPALLERGLGASFFVITSRIDCTGSLSALHLRALSAANMTVGSHGVSHVDWRKIAPQQLQAEIVNSKQVLEAIVGHEVSTASIPFGRYDRHVLSALRVAGYRKVFSSDGGESRPESYPAGRTNIRADTTISSFINFVGTPESSLARVVRGLKSLRRKFT